MAVGVRVGAGADALPASGAVGEGRALAVAAALPGVGESALGVPREEGEALPLALAVAQGSREV